MDPFTLRKYVTGALIVLVFGIYLFRLFFLQVLDSSFKLSADSNSQRHVTEYPARGLIYDRNGTLLVYNEATYDLMINPPQLRTFDTLAFCEILEISKDQLISGISEALSYSRFRPSILLKQISARTYAVLQEKLYQFPGFFVQARTLRNYPKPIAAHILGYVGEVNNEMIGNNPYYQMGDYIGISGLERSYEKFLRGEKGKRIYLVDVHNRVKGSFQDGRYDESAVYGQDLMSTIDAKLQEYGEKLMANMRGSIVAIEPATGEVLAFVSSPAYDPSLLVGRIRNRNYRMLAIDTLKPLFNRGLMASYPPGSTFKLMNALIAQQEGLLNTHSEFYCDMGFYAGRMFKRCRAHLSPQDLPGSIQVSCNTYYFQAFRNILENKKYESVADAFDSWRNHLLSFGFGQRLNTDFPHELTGFVPTVDYFDRFYGANRWRALTVISLGVGQGELGITPLQMANMTAAIANRGYFFTPHLVKKINGEPNIDPWFTEPHYTTIDSAYFEPVIKGMELVVNAPSGGTARIAKLQDIIVCGKTGTAENPHGDDHSVFVAFAPKDEPKIAISVYVENAGFGSTWAAPVASLMIEKYLTDTISRKWVEDRILNANLMYK